MSVIFNFSYLGDVSPGTSEPRRIKHEFFNLPFLLQIKNETDHERACASSFVSCSINLELSSYNYEPS